MRPILDRLVLSIGLTLVPRGAAAQAPPTIAGLGSCTVQSGETISGCRIGYRTFGTLSADRDNVVLIPTWFGGRSSDWIPLLGAAGIVDTTRFFVVVADALGNGVSSEIVEVDGSTLFCIVRRGGGAFVRQRLGQRTPDRGVVLNEEQAVRHGDSLGGSGEGGGGTPPSSGRLVG